MLGKFLSPAIHELIEDRDFQALKSELSQLPPADLAELFEELDEETLPVVFRLLTKEKATDVFEHLELEQQELLLKSISQEQMKRLLEDMSVDDRTALLDELPPEVASQLISLLPEKERAAVQTILNYPEDSAGRMMTPDYVSLSRDLTVADALDKIRRFGQDKETVYACYVIGHGRKLLGFVSLRRLVTSALNTPIEDLFESNYVYLQTDTPQEEALNIFRKYDLIALPVLDSGGAMVGIVTFDDMMDVAEEEFREDMENFAAVLPGTQSFLDEKLWSVVLRRAPWLVGLLVVQGAAAMILSGYNHLLDTFIALSFFLPALTATGGNTGTQSAAMVIREIATGELDFSDFWKIVSQSILAGLALSAVLGIASFGLAMAIGRDPKIGLCVAIGLGTVVILSNMAGSILPLALKRWGLDPALMSGPFISTIVDVLGLLIYLQISQVILTRL